MIIYFAAAEAKNNFALLNNQNVDMLFSYYKVMNANLNCYKTKSRIFLDSGAFSAYTQEKKIEIDKYIDFIKKYKNIFEIYANLDVIGDWKASAKNCDYMERKGLNPLPVFHFKSPLHELKRICQEYDYLALGGLVPLSLKIKTLRAWLDTCFSVIKNYWPKKIHGFGVNSYWAWFRYPFYSVDATSWLAAGKYGKINTCNKEISKIYSRTKDYKERCQISVNKYKEIAAKITNIWETRGIKWK